MCGRALLIRSGSLHAEGVPERVIADYVADASGSENGEFDFSNHHARSAGHNPIIRRLVLRSGDGTPTSFFYPDDSLQVELTLDPPNPIREPRVAISIEDSLGRRIMTLASYFEKLQLPDMEGLFRIRCSLPKLSLGSGRYLISVSIGTKYSGLLDAVENAAWFEVGWRNNYCNGEPYNPIYGPVLAQSVWTPMDEEA